MGKQSKSGAENRRESFVFYRSFFEAIREADEADQIALYTAVCNYALDGIEPNLSGLLLAVFTAIRPQIDANNRRRENAKKGGAPTGNTNAKRNNQKQPKTTEARIIQPNVNVNENVELEIEFIADAQGKIDFLKFKEELTKFADAQGIEEEQREKFYTYTLSNYALYAEEKGAGNLYNRDGEIIANWKGAFIAFATSGYNREQWEKDHGVYNEAAAEARTRKQNK